MTGAQRGFLLWTSRLGDPTRKPLTVAQFRDLAHRVQQMTARELDRDLHVEDLMSVGYGEDFARYILQLLRDEELLEYYLIRGKRAQCYPITRLSSHYPTELRRRLAMESPGVLWAKGDLSALSMPRVSLVGSRDLQSDNAAFAIEVGRQTALQGYALVSGNARGADKLAQNACLQAGGWVISVVADNLAEHTEKEHMLYLSENGFDEAFSSQRALSRNRVIHSLGAVTFVAQARLRQGGTWDGTEKNLRHGWSPVCCYADDSIAQRTLADMGAQCITMDSLRDISALSTSVKDLFNMEEAT